MYYNPDDHDDIEDTSTTDWDDPIPVHKLWVHPDLKYDAATLTDADAMADADDGVASAPNDIGWVCPRDSCTQDYGADGPLTYRHLREMGGVVRCYQCGMAMLAHKQTADSPPPDDIDGANTTFGASPFGGSP